ncbi:unnamed protein product, partial [Symbiodinium sp. KB8]
MGQVQHQKLSRLLQLRSEALHLSAKFHRRLILPRLVVSGLGATRRLDAAQSAAESSRGMSPGRDPAVLHPEGQRHHGHPLPEVGSADSFAAAATGSGAHQR